MNQINLNYTLTGHGETLVFVHGLGSSARDWEPQVIEFSKSYQVLAFDMRGHGQSDKPTGPYTIPMLADDLASLLNHLGIPAAHIVGLSLGGMVALQFALAYPALVKTLTVVNSGPRLGGTPEQAEQEVARRVGIVQQYGMRGMGEALSPNIFPKPEHAALRRTFVERRAENDPAAYIEATRAMLGWDVTDRLGSIQCPTLIVASDQDYSPVKVKEAYTRLMPNAELVVIPDAHHVVSMERPEAFNAVLRDFLAQHSGR